MTPTEIYYYFFYKFYKFAQLINPSGWRRLGVMQSSIFLFIVELWLITGLLNELECLFPKDTSRLYLIIAVFISGVAIFGLKSYFFYSNDRWKAYVHDFDQWPSERNNNGTLVVVAVILLIIGNLVFSIYLNPPPGGLDGSFPHSGASLTKWPKGQRRLVPR